jgi:hypothetical protein
LYVIKNTIHNNQISVINEVADYLRANWETAAKENAESDLV